MVHSKPDPLYKAAQVLNHAIWTALTTVQSHLALTRAAGCRYLPAIAPFAALDPSIASATALRDLALLTEPGETLYLPGDIPPQTKHFRYDDVLACLQMVFPDTIPLPRAPEGPGPLVSLPCDKAPEMVALIEAAYPGFFRAETCRMGRYWGLRHPTTGRLLAMGGERLQLAPEGGPAWREISGLCSDPALAGKGLGTVVLCHILALHRAEGSRSWLHVSARNTKAITLYQRLGFVPLRTLDLHRLERTLS